jgi:hypothetical protein
VAPSAAASSAAALAAALSCFHCSVALLRAVWIASSSAAFSAAALSAACSNLAASSRFTSSSAAVTAVGPTESSDFLEKTLKTLSVNDRVGGGR